MKIYVRIKADYNDADYIESTRELRSPDDILLLKNIAPYINKYKYNSNWSYDSRYKLYSENFSEAEIDRVNSYVPYASENNQVHTIEEIELIYVEKKDKLL